MKNIQLLVPFLCIAIAANSQINTIPDLDGKYQTSPFVNVLNQPFVESSQSGYTLFPNFPVNFPFDAFDPKGGVVTANLDLDTDLEIIVGSTNHLYGVNKDGSIVAGWNKSYLTGLDVIHPAAIGDIDGDGKDDIVVVAGGQTSGNVYAYNSNGSLKSGFPFTSIGVVPMMPVLADIDKDGDDEIIVLKRLSGSAGGEVYVLKGDGSVFPGWPYSMGSGEFPGSSVAVGDINNNGSIEIVGESRNKVWVWNTDGTVLMGFPFDLDANDIIINSYSAPVLVDIDNDRQHEIVFCAHNPGGIMYVLKNDGTLYPGWPKTTPQWIYASPIAVDIDNDDTMELFVQEQFASVNPACYIYGFDKDGNDLSGFPFGPIYGGANQLTVADLDNNGDWELTSEDNIQNPDGSGQYIAINHDGTIFSDFPMVTKGNSFFKQMVLEDLDSDGMLDLIGAGADLNSNIFYLQAWSTSIAYTPSKIINPYIQLNKKHDGYYPLKTVTAIDERDNQKVTTFAYPNPFKNSFTLYSTTKIIEVTIENLQGRKVYAQKQNATKLQIFLPNEQAGIYIATVKHEDGSMEKIKLNSQH